MEIFYPDDGMTLWNLVLIFITLHTLFNVPISIGRWSNILLAIAPYLPFVFVAKLRKTQGDFAGAIFVFELGVILCVVLSAVFTFMKDSKKKKVKEEEPVDDDPLGIRNKKK